jgi:hypothetical protein
MASIADLSRPPMLSPVVFMARARIANSGAMRMRSSPDARAEDAIEVKKMFAASAASPSQVLAVTDMAYPMPSPCALWNRPRFASADS